MKFIKIAYKLWVVILLLFASCNTQKENLDYPKSIEQIKEVSLSRPDVQSKGKFAEQRILHEKEIEELLVALDNAKSIGPTKFKPDYFIVFKTKEGDNKKIRVNGNTIKGYQSDFSYKINFLKFLNEF